MSLRRSSFLALALASLALGSACIDDPNLVQVDEGARGATRVSGDGDDQMVLIAATTFTSPGTLMPTGPGDERHKGKGDGGDKDDGDDKRAGGGDGDGVSDDPGGGTSGTNGSSPIAVPAFWIDVNEVSASAYAACVTSGACTAAGADEGCTAPSAKIFGSYPINCVTIEQARAFCAQRGKRLVKNDEWTAASGGAALRPYPWGTEPPSSSLLNACGSECTTPSLYADSDGFPRTAPRGSFPAGKTPEGVNDLAGNVAEWVDLPGTTAARGGSFADTDAARVGTMSFHVAANADPRIGFRCARDP